MTPSDMPEKVNAERLREIVDGCEGVTPGPWFYRPQEHDDWGWVRATPPSDGGPGWLIATARRGRAEQPGEDDIHRSTQTDPYGENARHIARLDPATVRSIGLELIEARALIDTLQRERDEARETNRRLNRVNQQLQSDIANDRHILNAATKNKPNAQRSVEGEDWTLSRCYLRVFKDRATVLARAEAAEADVTRLRADRDRFFDSLRQMISLNAVRDAATATAPLWLEHAEKIVIEHANALSKDTP